MRQWGALGMLAIGVALVQISGGQSGEDKNAGGQNPLLGFAAVMTACCTSGFAGVYFEKVSEGVTI